MKNKKLKFKKLTLKLVNLAKYGFLVEPRYYFYDWSKMKSCFSRSSVAKKLLFAKKYLPNGYNFKIWDGFRTRKTQRLVRLSFKKRLENSHPDWDSKKILDALNVFTGLPNKKTTLKGHFTGGALDLIIVNENGEELDMGADFDDITEKAALNYFETTTRPPHPPALRRAPKKSLNWREKNVKKNRRLLTRVMKKSGFKPYPPEWWHWFYDR